MKNGDRDDDSHLAPVREEPVERGGITAPPGLRSLSRFANSISRFTRLAERQGTRLVDLIERWVVTAEDHTRQVERHADATERLTEILGGSGYTDADANDGEPENTNDE